MDFDYEKEIVELFSKQIVFTGKHCRFMKTRWHVGVAR